MSRMIRYRVSQNSSAMGWLTLRSKIRNAEQIIMKRLRFSTNWQWHLSGVSMKNGHSVREKEEHIPN